MSALPQPAPPAARPAPRRHLLRDEREPHARVTFVELFFDLVFVFAITQLSHGLLEHFTPRGGAETALLMTAVWWVWIYTSWATNWLDPDRVPVRIMLFAMMLAGLVLAAAIPLAFTSRGAAFALPFAAMQVGRTAFVVAAMRHRPVLRLNFIRILAWLSLSGVLWVGGGFAPPGQRPLLWSAALLVELLGPIVAYWVPRAGASAVSSWNIRGEHMAERCGLFVIIALGESVLVTGATFAKLAWTPEVLLAFAIAFAGTAALWWNYFNATAAIGSAVMTHSPDAGRMGRLAYTYIHLPIVAGIVLTAVGDEMLLAHPGGHAGFAEWLAIAGGPAVYLGGIVLFKASLSGRVSAPRLLAIAALLALGPIRAALSPLALAAAVALILVAIGAWETIEMRRHPLPPAAEPARP